MVDVLSNLSDELTSIVKQIGASVVQVEGRRRVPASGIIWSADGVIVTAHHVVEQEDNIRVGLPGGQTVSATLVGRDATTDLAVLRAEAKELPPPKWIDPEGVSVGHLVLALGRPGQSVRVTLGIVSVLGGSWVTPAGGGVSHYLQTDVVMYPGFSGGPLVGVGGQVLGLNSSALLRGLSITVPSPTVRKSVETLLAHGRIRRGYLGVGMQPVRLPHALVNEVGHETGLLLVSVASASPAEQGGLLLGDTIVALDGRPVRFIDELQAILSGPQIGSSVPVRFIRGGELKELTVSIGENT